MPLHIWSRKVESDRSPLVLAPTVPSRQEPAAPYTVLNTSYQSFCSTSISVKVSRISPARISL